jgi:hypothetical protein
MTPARQKDVLVPANWERDALSKFLQAAHDNRVATLKGVLSCLAFARIVRIAEGALIALFEHCKSKLENKEPPVYTTRGILLLLEVSSL